MRRRIHLPLCGLFLSLFSACGGQITASDQPNDATTSQIPHLYASELIDFVPGQNAGFGQNDLPNVVLGPPVGRGVLSGSLDVLSLGVGGSIVLSFGTRMLIDGPGPDFLVFENPFWPQGRSDIPFVDLGKVSVSADGVNWHEFKCEQMENSPNRYAGCAGWNPVQDFDPYTTEQLNPQFTGGDPFDLAEVGLAEAQYIRIVDTSTQGAAPTAGFDLDAVGLINHR